MNNNPTIDGVSRDYVLRLTGEAHSVMLGMVEHCLNIRACMGMDEGFKDFDTEEEHDFVKELRALLDAPAVERQGVTNGPLINDLCALNADQQSVITQQNLTIEKLRGQIQHMIDQTIPLVPDENNPMWTRRITIDELQSTIARLEARIAELESGRGEPVAWLHTMNFEEGCGYQSRITASPENAFGKPGLNYDAVFRVASEPLFTATPAPVAVVLPERIAFTSQGTFDQGWNACLDATEALNGLAK